MSGQLIIGVGGNQSSSSSIPKNSVTSDMVKSIVVTDSAPIKEDNVLYFEYQANGSNTVNGVAIDGDPGATAQYTFTLTLNAVENETVDARTQQITVEGAGGSSVSATLTLNQTAGDPTLEVSPTSIDVPQDGSEVQVQVTTNTTFTVS